MSPLPFLRTIAVLLCSLCVTGIGQRKEWVPYSHEELVKAAVSNNSYAQAVLGLYLIYGELGYAVDLDLAKKWSSKSITANEPLGFFNLGGIYECDGNLTEASRYYEKARSALDERIIENDAVSLFVLGKLMFEIIPTDKPKALALYQRSASLGFSLAQGTLGDYYLSGLPGLLKKNVQKGIELLKKSVKAHSLKGRFQLGMAYLKGESLSPKVDSGMDLLELAVSQKSREAQFALSQLLMKGGRGYQSNPDRAKQLLNSAAAQGHADARAELEERMQRELENLLGEGSSDSEWMDLSPSPLAFEEEQTENVDHGGAEAAILITGANSFNTQAFIEFVENVQAYTDWLDYLNSDLQAESSLRLLADEIRKELRIRGFLDAQVSFSVSEDTVSKKLLIEISEGEKEKFLGYRISQEIPDWLSSELRSLVGLDEHSEKFLSSMTFDNSGLTKNVSTKRWFGDAFLMSHTGQSETKPYLGFFSESAATAQSHLIDCFHFLERKDSFPYPLLWNAEDKIGLLVGSLSARKGYPATRFEFFPLRTGEGFYLEARLSNYQSPLLLGNIELEGLNLHDPEFVRQWLFDQNNLKKGMVLTTAKLIEIKDSLVRSCCFYDIGVYPNSLADETTLLISLRDHVRLPKLNKKLNDTEAILKEVSQFIYQNPYVFLSMEEDFSPDKKFGVQANLDSESNRLSLDILDGESEVIGSLLYDQGIIAADIGGERIHTKVNHPIMVFTEGIIHPWADHERIRTFSFGVGFHTHAFANQPKIYIEPAFWMLDANDSKIQIGVKKPHEQVIILPNKMKGKIRILRDKQGIEQVRVEAKGKFQCAFLRGTPLPNLNLKGSSVKTTEDFFKGLKGLLGLLSKKKILSSPMEQFFVFEVIVPQFPKYFEGIVNLIVENDGTKDSHFEVSFDEKGKFLLERQNNLQILQSHLEGDLVREERSWPALLTRGISSRLFGKSQLFERSVSTAIDMNETYMGPLGNMAWGIFCENFSKPLAKQFFRKAKETNFTVYFSEDLHRLGVEEEIYSYLLKLTMDADARAAFMAETKLNDYLSLFTFNPDEPPPSQFGEKLLVTMFNGHLRGRISNWLDEKLTIEEEKLRDGLVMTNYPNGAKKSEAHYHEGKRHGRELLFFDNGLIEQNASYFNDKIHGRSVGFYRSGKQSFVEHYEHGQLHGYRAGFWEDGALYYEETYLVGSLEGLAKGWYENTNQEYENHWSNGKVQSCTRWKPDGERCPDTNVTEGSGINVIYFPNGNKSRRITLIGGLKNGNEILYFEDGMVRQVANFREGLLEGESRVYHPNGNLATIEFFKNGKKHGKDIDFNQLGQKVSEVFFMDGLQTGESSYFSPNDK